MKYTKWSFIVVPNQESLKGKDSVLQCVYMWVCKFADEEWICYPSYQTIADCSGCSRRTVVTKINDLVSLWLLGKSSRFYENKQQSNLYQIMLICGSDSLRGAGDAPPSAGIALPPVQEMHTELLPPFNSTTELSSKEEEPKAEFWKLEINHVLEQIKEKCKGYGIVYDQKDERNFWKHILSKKFTGIAEEYGFGSWLEFALNILDASMQEGNRWNYKIKWPKDIYQKYPSVYSWLREWQSKSWSFASF